MPSCVIIYPRNLQPVIPNVHFSTFRCSSGFSMFWNVSFRSATCVYSLLELTSMHLFLEDLIHHSLECCTHIFQTK